MPKARDVKSAHLTAKTLVIGVYEHADTIYCGYHSAQGEGSLKPFMNALLDPIYTALQLDNDEIYAKNFTLYCNLNKHPQPQKYLSLMLDAIKEYRKDNDHVTLVFLTETGSYINYKECVDNAWLDENFTSVTELKYPENESIYRSTVKGHLAHVHAEFRKQINLEEEGFISLAAYDDYNPKNLALPQVVPNLSVDQLNKFGIQCEHFLKRRSELWDKIIEIRKDGCELIASELTHLHKVISAEAETYFNNPSEQSYQIFKDKTLDEIQRVKQKLNIKNTWRELLTNLAYSVINFVCVHQPITPIRTWAKNTFSLFNHLSTLKFDGLQKSIVQLTPTPPQNRT